jgi:hypothetical protein
MSGAHLLDQSGDLAGDWLGFSSARRNRRTGTLVVVIDDRTSRFDADSMTDYGNGPAPWWTVCDDHATLVCHPTRSLAEAHAARPWEWCEACGDLIAE